MWCSLDVQDVEKKLNTHISVGLSEDEVKKRQQKFGKNKLQEGKKTSFFIKFIKQFNDFMIIILIISAIVSAGIAYYEHSNDYIDSIIIIGIVINSLLLKILK